MVRRFGSRYNWTQVAVRPVRPMKTVVLDQNQKRQILADMNEYLHPATPRWYANRGIPLRRGYLFHGPPGTGKTSLSFALAGVFGLEIYVISLLEPSITEEDLVTLFNSLPRRCVVLLEDIDTAGLRRPDDEVTEADKEHDDEDKDKDKEKKKDEDKDKEGGEKAALKEGKAGGRRRHDSTAKNDWKVSDLARALKKEGNADTERKGISLSGLLNAIDGVASHEGRVLIMTTNKPESLDEALIRPGRVDLQVGFTNATPQQATELFQRMYEVDAALPHRRPVGGVTNGAAVASVPSTNLVGPAKGVGNGVAVSASAAKAELKTGDDKASTSSSSSSSPERKANATPEPSSSGQATTHGRELSILWDDFSAVDIAPEELTEIAAQFGAKIPDGRFSPAEIQGFLLKRKKDPRRALDETDAWVEAMTQLKETRTKVLRVQ